MTLKWKLPQLHTAKVLNAWPGHTLLNVSQFSFSSAIKAFNYKIGLVCLHVCMREYKEIEIEIECKRTFETFDSHPEASSLIQIH